MRKALFSTPKSTTECHFLPRNHNKSQITYLKKKNHSFWTQPKTQPQDEENDISENLGQFWGEAGHTGPGEMFKQ